MISKAYDMISLFLDDINEQGIELWGNGHINATFRVNTNRDQLFIFQRVNTHVFPYPEVLISNHRQLIESFGNHEFMRVPKLARSKRNRFLEYDKEGSPWRLMEFVMNSQTVEVVHTLDQAYEAGLGFGTFNAGCLHLDLSRFEEAIVDFHNLSKRMIALSNAAKKDPVSRRTKSEDLINFFEKEYDRLKHLVTMLDNGTIPLRVVHNDTKVNNLLFRNDRAIAVIDLDTIGPGSIIYDFGDAIRTISNERAEDEKDLEKVKFNNNFFEAFTRGYLLRIGTHLTPTEQTYLWQSPFYMTLIMGVRFLTDYLLGDTYYKTGYADHNLIRSRVQARLIKEMHSNKPEIQNTIKRYLEYHH